MNLRKHREILIVAGVAAALVVGVRAYTINSEPPAAVQESRFPAINQHGEPEDRSGATTVLALDGAAPSTPVRVGSNQCIQWWGERPDAYRVEVAGIDGDDWQPNEAFLAQKRAGDPPYNFPAWYRFIGTGAGGAKVSYKVLRGLCQ